MGNYTRHRMLGTVTTQRNILFLYYYYCCQSFCAPHFVCIMYIKITTIFCAAWYVRPLQWFCRVKAVSQEGHSPVTCVGVPTDGAATRAGGGLLRWCHKKATHPLCVAVLTSGSGWGAMEMCAPQRGRGCFWGATAGVDNSPLRVTKEELEAV